MSTHPRTPLLRSKLLTAALSGLLLAFGAAGWAQQGGAEAVTVQRGDTFSSIAARFGVELRQWRKLYDPQRSGLADPNLLLVGQKLELVNADGAKYLRVAGAAAKATAIPAARTAGAATVQSPVAPAPTPAPAPKPAPVASPSTAAASPAPAADDTLTIGLIPNIPAPAVLAQYEHLKRYLERNNSFKVRLVVPANFKAFFDGTLSGEYDVSVGPPHMQRVAQQEKGLLPLGIFEPRIGALFVTPIEQGVASAREVSGKAVGFANPQSLVAMFGQQWLRSQNLEGGRDYEVKSARTDMGIGRLMLTGEAAAGIMSNGEYRALPAEESARLKIVEVFARIPNFIWLANPKMDRARMDKLRAQLRGFFADKEDGAAFARATGLSGISDADDATMRELDPFSAATRRAMGLTGR